MELYSNDAKINMFTLTIMEETNENIATDESELRNETESIYVGLERLDELAKDEPLLEGFAEHGTEIGKERARARLAAIKAEREALFEKYGLTKELEEYSKNHRGIIPDDSKTISRLLIKRAADQLPRVQEGYTRMFRGEGPHPGSTEDWTIGRWFSHDLDITSSYPIGPRGTSRLIYVDIPVNSLGQYHVNDMPEFKGASKIKEYLLPKERVDQSKEFIRFLTTDTSGDPWATVR